MSLSPLKFSLPIPLQDLHLRAKRELSRQNTVAMLSMCKVVREMRSLEPYYKTLMDELPSNNFSRYTGLADKFEALVCGVCCSVLCTTSRIVIVICDAVC